MSVYKVISLFDGMSCGQIALKELGIKPVYYASEIDKFAIGETQLNFENTIQLGDIEKWREWKIDWSKINLILAGSPCQGFSFAGKQLNFEDPRSKLFFVFVDILNHCKKLNPDVKFLLENVKMTKSNQRVINNMLGIFPARINSNKVSAQNRDRLYWTNIKIKMVGLFNEIHSDIPQPKDRGILLKDILQPESEIDEKYYIKNPKFISDWNFNQNKPTNITQKKHRALLANSGGKTKGVGIYGIDINGKAPTQRNSTGRCLDEKHNYQIIKLDKQLNKKTDQNKAGTLTAGAHSGGNHSDMDILALISDKNSVMCRISCDCGFDYIGTLKDICPSCKEIRSGYTNELTEDDNEKLRVGAAKFGRTDEAKEIRKQNMKKGRDYNPFAKKEIQNIDYEKMGALLTGSNKDNLLTDGIKLRRLTPLECARLQTVPSWYKWNCSDTQQYKMLGNGWTIEVIKHILSFLKPLT